MEILLNRDIIKEIKPQFHSFLQSEIGLSWVKERDEKDQFFKQFFNEDSIEKIDEGVLKELLNKLWAFSGWINKDYLLEQMLESGLLEIRRRFKTLLFGDKKLAIRFEDMKIIRMMGAASVSEILIHSNRTKYPIWNRKAKEGLLKIGANEKLIPKSTAISGSQYVEYCSLVHNVFEKVNTIIPEIDDLFQLNFFLYFISTTTPDVILPEIPLSEGLEFEHDTAIQDILQLGDSLGFDVDKEVTVTHGCRLDAVWRTRIGNLGQIKYAFEVHKSGSRDSAILNLQRSKADTTIQKVVLVSTSDELATFEREISTLPEEFRKSVGYFKITDLQKAVEYQENIKDILRNIGLTF